MRIAQSRISVALFSTIAIFFSSALFAQGSQKAATLEDIFKSTDWLAQNAADIVIVDTRPADDYAKGHIPGAISIPRTKFYFGRKQVDGKDIKYDIPTQAELIDILTNAGITPASAVLAYDNDISSYGGRFPWVLRSYGHEKAYVLDGGIDKWKDADGRALETKENKPNPAAAPYKIAAIGRFRSTKADLRAAIESGKGNQTKSGIVIVDVRSPGEYDGSTLYDKSDGARAGHVPYSVFVDYNSFVYADYLDAKGNPVKSSFQANHNVQVLKKAADLKAAFAAKGITPDKTIINYCEGGFRSGVYTLVQYGLGYQNVSNYDGSWNEWSKQGELYPVSKVEGK
jgi:thiosulfate/3-mercaptopyruvate sulfurtransferase